MSYEILQDEKNLSYNDAAWAAILDLAQLGDTLTQRFYSIGMDGAEITAEEAKALGAALKNKVDELPADSWKQRVEEVIDTCARGGFTLM